MTTINLSNQSGSDIYRLMIQTIIPRPIAWILSDNGNETYNLAPFSFFNGISSEPPLISVSIGHKSDGSKKDSWRNIEERSHFVLHMPSKNSMHQVSKTAESLPHGESELTKAGLETVLETHWSLPRLKDCAVAMLCERFEILQFQGCDQGFVIGKIKEIFIQDDLTSQQGHRLIVDAKKLDPLMRLGGFNYGALGDVFEVKS